LSDLGLAFVQPFALSRYDNRQRAPELPFPAESYHSESDYVLMDSCDVNSLIRGGTKLGLVKASPEVNGEATAINRDIS
jgi:hypothetical protein